MKTLTEKQSEAIMSLPEPSNTVHKVATSNLCNPEWGAVATVPKHILKALEAKGYVEITDNPSNSRGVRLRVIAKFDRDAFRMAKWRKENAKWFI